VILLFSIISFQVSLCHCFWIRISFLVWRTSEDWCKTNSKTNMMKQSEKLASTRKNSSKRGLLHCNFFRHWPGLKISQESCGRRGMSRTMRTIVYKFWETLITCCMQNRPSVVCTTHGTKVVGRNALVLHRSSTLALSLLTLTFTLQNKCLALRHRSRKEAIL
jgi:hypothetical protein